MSKHPRQVFGLLSNHYPPDYPPLSAVFHPMHHPTNPIVTFVQVARHSQVAARSGCSILHTQPAYQPCVTVIMARPSMDWTGPPGGDS